MRRYKVHESGSGWVIVDTAARRVTVSVRGERDFAEGICLFLNGEGNELLVSSDRNSPVCYQDRREVTQRLTTPVPPR
jgi:hypothetical protein